MTGRAVSPNSSIASIFKWVKITNICLIEIKHLKILLHVVMLAQCERQWSEKKPT